MTGAMRRAARVTAGLMLLACGACQGGPGALGITGPNPTGATPAGAYGATALPPSLSADDATVLAPGTPAGSGATYAPSAGPTYGDNGRYYGN
jgi:hypothetical protein